MKRSAPVARWRGPVHRAPALAVLLFLLTAAAARAQIFNVTAGASNLYNSEGLTLRMDQEGLQTAASIGYADGLKLGGEAEKDFGKATTARVGDSILPFVLPTDIFDKSHILLRRGFGLSHHAGANSWDAFAGGGAQNYLVPYLSYATIDHSLGMLFYTRLLTPRLTAATYLVSLGQTTAIEGLAWRPRNDLQLAVSAGVGSDHPFGALSLDLERAGWGVKASYTGQDGMFHRLSVDPTGGAEIVGANLLTWHTWQHFHVDASRNEYQSIAEFANQAATGTVLEAGASTSFKQADLSARIFKTTGGGIDRLNTSYTAQYSYRFVRSVATYFDSGASPGTAAGVPATPADRSLLVTEYVRANRRLELSSTFDLEDGNHNYSFGGTFTSNKLDASISQQTYFIPFAATRQLRQAWAINIRLHAFGNTNVELDSQLGSDDRTHYTAYAGDYLYREGTVWHTGAAPSFKEALYSIEGCVHTRAGEPVSGAAVTLGKEEVYTGLDGCFSYMPKRPGTYKVELTLEDFATPGRYASASPAHTVQLSSTAPHAIVVLELDRLPNDPQ